MVLSPPQSPVCFIPSTGQVELPALYRRRNCVLAAQARGHFEKGGL